MATWREKDLEKDLEKAEKGWAIAKKFSRERLERVNSWDGGRLEKAVEERYLVLETVCLFIHANIKCGQYRIPSRFWRELLTEHGIVVYPSAMTEDIDVHGMGLDMTFTEAYSGHIEMFDRCSEASHSPPCPMKYFREPPPEYQK
ncbi:hypothetical protein HRG_004359 [Hirsutella rhossiliensis]|uniref:Uncharacterized protein n=1 Tax=Hirsutella rhossiliensis TaxID=111463 RepID=A0A9P8SII7_9HYPO|nr:uncharacterized protein HRG_04359 [Hirsutella rhossiliensis]KAH0963931.1 hypothetical protein HRG_04359 [Hirsutella rhossiliensis]